MEDSHADFPLNSYFPDPEDQRIFAVLANYLMLSQFDVARSVIDGYFKVAPDRIVRLLRTLFQQPVPDHANWYVPTRIRRTARPWVECAEFGVAIRFIPSILSCVMSRRLLSNFSPSIASVSWFCAIEYERLWDMVTATLLSNPKHPLRDKMTAVNAFGFIDYDLLAVDVLEARELLLDEGYAASVVVQLNTQRFQTHVSHVPAPRAPQWAGYYAVYGSCGGVTAPTRVARP